MKLNNCDQCNTPLKTSKWNHDSININCPINGCIYNWYHDHKLCEMCITKLKKRRNIMKP